MDLLCIEQKVDGLSLPHVELTEPANKEVAQ